MNKTSIPNEPPLLQKHSVSGMCFSHLGLFEGIGGFSLAAHWMGWETKAWCEWNEFGQKVLRHHFPNAEGFGDITKTDFTKYANTIDILTGGFPCQPFSVAGKRKGEEDDRFLWHEMLRAIREVKPTYVVAENVSGLVTMDNGKTLDKILYDLENEGYKVEPVLIPACSKEAWHRRERIWILAYSFDFSNCANGSKEGKTEQIQEERKQERCARQPTGTSSTFHPNDFSKRNERIGKEKILEFHGIQRCEDFGRSAILGDRSDLPTPVLCRSYDGIPNGVDRIKALGNSIVPQVAYEIFKAIEAVHLQHCH